MSDFPNEKVLSVEEYIPTSDGDSLETRRAELVDSVMTIRLDWDGSNTNFGQFEVKDREGAWQRCGNLDPESKLNDLILIKPNIGFGEYQVRITRGPDHETRPFKAWVRRIEWLKVPSRDPGYTVGTYTPVRDTDYQYTNSSEHKDTMVHSEIVNGVQELTITLRTDHDYELWTGILHPTKSDVWCIQDPLIDEEDNDPPPPHQNSMPETIRPTQDI